MPNSTQIAVGGERPAGMYRLSLKERAANWVFYLPVVFMLLFFALPMALTVVFSVFERTQLWMEPGFGLQAYENFFFSARLNNFLCPCTIHQLLL